MLFRSPDSIRRSLPPHDSRLAPDIPKTLRPLLLLLTAFRIPPPDPCRPGQNRLLRPAARLPDDPHDRRSTLMAGRRPRTPHPRLSPTISPDIRFAPHTTTEKFPPTHGTTFPVRLRRLSRRRPRRRAETAPQAKRGAFVPLVDQMPTRMRSRRFVGA